MAGIRVIKFYAWEKHFSSKIFKLRYYAVHVHTHTYTCAQSNTYTYMYMYIHLHRQLELKSLRGRKYLDALCVYFWATTPVLISILTFTTYVALGHKLTAAKVSGVHSLAHTAGLIIHVHVKSMCSMYCSKCLVIKVSSNQCVNVHVVGCF